MKLTVEYDSEDGYLFPDGWAEAWVTKTVMNFLRGRKDQHLKVSSELLIDYFRLKLAKGIIRPDQIQFKFNDEILKTNKYGTLERWPKGFCDQAMNICEELLTIGADAAKAKRKKRLSEMSVDNELTGEQDIGWKNN